MKLFLIISLSLLASGTLFTLCYVQKPQFGKKPSNERLNRIKKSPNYKDGKFQNRIATPIFPDNKTMASEYYKTFFVRNPRKFPKDTIPSVKVDLKKLSLDSNYIIWFGHSSYFLQIDGKRILIDPVFSGAASPLAVGVKALPGTDAYSTEDIPEIDYLIISHDHFDHLDYNTVTKLNSKIKHVVCGLGVGEHFELWGFDTAKIIEKDWDETVVVGEKFKIHTAYARHGSGRFTSTNNTLWMSYVIDAPSMRIYYGGDSGYANHFSELGKKFGSFDLAILENGQYIDEYSTIHMPPRYVIQAAKDLNAKRLFPGHSSKFVLGRHDWDEPLIKITKLAEEANIPLLTPEIGEAVNLADTNLVSKQWWKGLN